MQVEVLDSRRLTGPNLLGERPGAVIDVSLEGDRAGDPGAPGEWVDAWRAAATRILAAVGWSDETTLARVFPGQIEGALRSGEETAQAVLATL